MKHLVLALCVATCPVMAAMWSTLESAVNHSLGELAGLDPIANPIAMILVHHASLPQKLDMLGALCEQRVPSYPHLKSYKAVISKLQSAQKSRNLYMHNGMSPNPETGKIEMGKGSARGTLKLSINDVDLADI